MSRIISFCFLSMLLLELFSGINGNLMERYDRALRQQEKIEKVIVCESKEQK